MIQPRFEEIDDPLEGAETEGPEASLGVNLGGFG
jgi:hypothetical protein